MTPGRKFSRTTCERATSSLKILFPSGVFKLMVTDCLPAFTATKEVPINSFDQAGSAPSWRARSPVPGCSILMISAPRSANWKLQKGPARTLVRSRTRTPSRGSDMAFFEEPRFQSSLRNAFSGLKPHPNASAPRPNSRLAGTILYPDYRDLKLDLARNGTRRVEHPSATNNGSVRIKNRVVVGRPLQTVSGKLL